MFPVSENHSIGRFEPRRRAREDIGHSEKLVWAVNEARLANFLTPRDCPRVTFYAKGDTTPEDIDRFIGNSRVTSVIAIEHGWLHRMNETRLAVYRILPNLWPLGDAVKSSSLGFSMCRMRNAISSGSSRKNRDFGIPTQQAAVHLWSWLG
ncbi:MAG: DUF6886 family protein [Limnochordia bacterium]